MPEIRTRQHPAPRCRDRQIQPQSHSSRATMRPVDEANLAAHERERIADEREAALINVRFVTAAHEASTVARIDAAKVVLADAATRMFELTNAMGGRRERATRLDSFINPDTDQHDEAIKARRASAIDRSEAKSDRSSSANDRSKLTDG